jgi:hypothetical protein
MKANELNITSVEKIITVIHLAREYYRQPGNLAGGSLHIVLDDGNLDDSDILFCIEYAKKEKDELGVQLGEHLLSLNEDEREYVYSRYDKYAI